MKFNWGTGIAAVIVIFLLTMAFIIYKSYQQKYPLVEKEYYPRGLEYDKQMERIKNTAALTEKFRVEQAGQAIILHQPQILAEGFGGGKIHFYRPSDENADVFVDIKVDTTHRQMISAGILKPGKYVVKINWLMKGKEYYHEETIYIQK